MSQVNTCLLGAVVDVLPDPETPVTADGVGEPEQKRYRGTIVNVFQMPPSPGMPHFYAPHYSVLVGKDIWPVIPPCRIEVVEVPSLEPQLVIADGA